MFCSFKYMCTDSCRGYFTKTWSKFFQTFKFKTSIYLSIIIFLSSYLPIYLSAHIIKKIKINESPLHRLVHLCSETRHLSLSLSCHINWNPSCYLTWPWPRLPSKPPLSADDHFLKVMIEKILTTCSLCSRLLCVSKCALFSMSSCALLAKSITCVRLSTRSTTADSSSFDAEAEDGGVWLARSSSKSFCRTRTFWSAWSTLEAERKKNTSDNNWSTFCN